MADATPQSYYHQSDSIANLVPALAAAQAAFGPIEKDREVTIPGRGGSFTYSYTTLPSLLDQTRNVLLKNCIIINQWPTGGSGWIGVWTQVSHTSGEWMAAELRTLFADEVTPQNLGGHITAMRRHSYSAVLGLASEREGDDAPPARPAYNPPAATASQGAPTAGGDAHREAAPPVDQQQGEGQYMIHSVELSRKGTNPNTGKDWTKWLIHCQDGPTLSTFSSMDQECAGACHASGTMAAVRWTRSQFGLDLADNGISPVSGGQPTTAPLAAEPGTVTFCVERAQQKEVSKAGVVTAVWVAETSEGKFATWDLGIGNNLVNAQGTGVVLNATYVVEGQNKMITAMAPSEGPAAQADIPW